MGKLLCFIFGLLMFWLGYEFNLACDPTDPNSCTLCGPIMYVLGFCVIIAPWLVGSKPKNQEK